MPFRSRIWKRVRIGTDVTRGVIFTKLINFLTLSVLPPGTSETNSLGIK